MRLERNEVDADDNVWQPFSGSTVYPYIDFDIVDLPKDYVNDTTWMTLHVELSHNHRLYTRKNYAIFDLIGDLEAVFSGLIDIFSVLCFVVFKFKIPQENSVINHIFRAKSRKTDKSEPIKISLKTYFKDVLSTYFPCWFKGSRDSKRFREVGMRRVDRHLDALNYLQQAMLTKAMLKLLVSKKDRQNLKKTGKFIIYKGSDDRGDSSSSTSSNYESDSSSNQGS